LPRPPDLPWPRRCPMRSGSVPPSQHLLLTIFSYFAKYCLMKSKATSITLCRYWVKPDQEARFRELLERHWPTFEKLGLVADHPPHLIFRGEDPDRGIFYVETFPWRSNEAVERAHSLPEVAAIWEPMGECCTAMEFPGVEQVEL